jgi:hypothetical protein
LKGRLQERWPFFSVSMRHPVSQCRYIYSVPSIEALSRLFVRKNDHLGDFPRASRRAVLRTSVVRGDPNSGQAG